jgi:hypothetical protein
MSGEQTVKMDVSGMEDLQEALVTLAGRYPDKAGDLLRKDGRSLRKMIAKEARQQTDTNESHKMSLGKIGSYNVSEVKGLGTHQYVEISAKAPHFHLVENGHMMKTKSGKTVGFVVGVHFLDKATKEYKNDMPEHVENMVDELLKEAGLI